MVFTSVKSFVQSEQGAVTVDWVVLSAAIVGLGVAAISVVSGGVETLSTNISTSLADTDPNASPFAATETTEEDVDG